VATYFLSPTDNFYINFKLFVF